MDNGLYKVTLFHCRLPIPLQFASHPWFICEGDGKIDRWEVWQGYQKCETSWGHVHQNLFRPLRGMIKYPGWLNVKSKAMWPAKQLYHLEGDGQSSVRDIVRFIRAESPVYEFRESYKYFPGPNSNTYAQWIVDSFDDFDLKLPWTCIGKNYKRGALLG